MATIHSKIRARHERRGIADQEDCGSSIFSGHTQPPKHVLASPVSPPLREFLEELFDHSCDDITRRNGIDSYTMFTPF